MKTLLLAAGLGVFLTGCATNPVAQFYQDYTKQMPVAFQQRLLPPNGNPRIIAIAEAQHKEEIHHLEEQGYVLIGVTGFQGPAITQPQLIRQAKKTGADIVIFSSEFSGTQQGVRPIVSYQPGQTYTTSEFGTVNANAYGSGGYASGFGTYSGSATTTSPGTFNTQYVPYQYSTYRTMASFWRQMKPSILGVRFNPIPDDLRTALQRNTGAYVSAVIQDSPAFKANILEGDIIIQVADKPVTSAQECSDSLRTYAGQKVPIKVIRNGQTLDIDVQLNEISN
jgi:PDZ domain